MFRPSWRGKIVVHFLPQNTQDAELMLVLPSGSAWWRHDVPFGGLSDVPVLVGSQPPASPPQKKTEILDPRIGLSSVNDKHQIPIIQYDADHDEIFTTWMGLRGWSQDFPSKSKMADGGHIELMLVSVPSGKHENKDDEENDTATGEQWDDDRKNRFSNCQSASSSHSRL